jgi:hypothetical protein
LERRRKRIIHSSEERKRKGRKKKRKRSNFVGGEREMSERGESREMMRDSTEVKK